MKIIKVVLASLCFSVVVNSQTINIEYIYNKSSSRCIEEKHQVKITNEAYNRFDKYSHENVVSTPSKKISSGYDDQDIYYEVFSPKFYLDAYGIDAYRQVYQYLIKIFYQKRDGEILYIIEQNMEDKNDPPKFLLTQLGATYFCHNKAN